MEKNKRNKNIYQSATDIESTYTLKKKKSS